MMQLALACLAIAGGADHITAGDLGFSGVDASTPISLAPAPGVQRVFSEAELQRLAVRFHADPPEGRICFERPATPVDPDRVLAAMQQTLPAASIEILEISRYAAPEGPVEFPLSGLRQALGAGFWNGTIRYAGNRKFAIWARVKVVTAAPRVIASEAIKPGQPIGASQLRAEMYRGFPVAAEFPTSIADVAGKLARRAIAPGAVIQSLWLESPKEIMRGDTVRVEVHSGSAILQFEGQAETGGSVGESIIILNPSSKKRFQAQVEAKGRVTVEKSLQ